MRQSSLAWLRISRRGSDCALPPSGAGPVLAEVVSELPLVVLFPVVIDLDAGFFKSARHTGNAAADLGSARHSGSDSRRRRARTEQDAPNHLGRGIWFHIRISGVLAETGIAGRRDLNVRRVGRNSGPGLLVAGRDEAAGWDEPARRPVAPGSRVAARCSEAVGRR